MESSTLLLIIIVCEIGFWVLLLSGLACRYLFSWRALSTFLLACVPLVDLILLGATVIDLRNGATATFAHGLAAAYIGFTVGFGGATVTWADRKFAYHFADGDAPVKPPSHGRELLVFIFGPLWSLLFYWAPPAKVDSDASRDH